MNGCNRLHLQTYVDEFVYRHNMSCTRVELLDKILEDIGSVYNANIEYVLPSLDNEDKDGIILCDDDDEEDGTWSEDDDNEDLIVLLDNDDDVECIDLSQTFIVPKKEPADMLPDITLQFNDIYLDDKPSPVLSARLTSNFLQVNSTVKTEPTKEAQSIVENVVNNIATPSSREYQCGLCLAKGQNKFLASEWGLKLHQIKMHK